MVDSSVYLYQQVASSARDVEATGHPRQVHQKAPWPARNLDKVCWDHHGLLHKAPVCVYPVPWQCKAIISVVQNRKVRNRRFTNARAGSGSADSKSFICNEADLSRNLRLLFLWMKVFQQIMKQRTSSISTATIPWMRIDIDHFFRSNYLLPGSW